MHGYLQLIWALFWVVGIKVQGEEPDLVPNGTQNNAKTLTRTQKAMILHILGVQVRLLNPASFTPTAASDRKWQASSECLPQPRIKAHDQEVLCMEGVTYRSPSTLRKLLEHYQGLQLGILHA